jgi:hypothetical protein
LNEVTHLPKKRDTYIPKHAFAAVVDAAGEKKEFPSKFAEGTGSK